MQCQLAQKLYLVEPLLLAELDLVIRLNDSPSPAFSAFIFNASINTLLNVPIPLLIFSARMANLLYDFPAVWWSTSNDPERWFFVALTGELNPLLQEVFAVLFGDDVLEVFFGRLRVKGKHDPNWNCDVFSLNSSGSVLREENVLYDILNWRVLSGIGCHRTTLHREPFGDLTAVLIKQPSLSWKGSNGNR